MRGDCPTKGCYTNEKKNCHRLHEEEHTSVLNKEAEVPSTTFVSFYQSTLHQFSEDNIFNFMSYVKDTL
jgi:hypothetical protein